MPDEQTIIEDLADAWRLKRAYDEPTERYRSEQFYIEDVDGETYVAIAGSNDAPDWWQNLTAIWPLLSQKQIKGTPYNATRGYVNSAAKIMRVLPGYLNQLRPIRIMGHSAGGPEAAIAGLMLLTSGYSVVSLKTYGSPLWTQSPIHVDLILESRRIETVGDKVPYLLKPTRCRPWVEYGSLTIYGRAQDNHLGPFRDAIDVHWIEHYIRSIEENLP